MPSAPITLAPLPTGTRHTWAVPGSKSITNRAYVLAALAEGRSTLTGALASDDTRYMRAALGELGIDVEDTPARSVVINGGRSRLRAPDRALFLGNSGTSTRFLAALAALVPGAVTLAGDAAMARRPIQDQIDGLRQLGLAIDCATGCPPLTVHGGRLPGGQVRLRGDRSSQYLSGLILAAGLAEGAIDIVIEGELVSRPYVEITRRMVADFGGRIDATPAGFRVLPPAGGYRARVYAIEPDASSASYAFAAAIATGATITVPGLGRDAAQGDYAFLAVLASIGAHVERGADATTISAAGRARGVDVDMHHISDTVMTLAALAPLCDGPTTIRNVANIRIKECDRLLATVSELRRLGQSVEHGDDWLRIHPRPLRPAVVECYDDHRIAMAFAILGLARPGVTIADPDCVAKTYPGFWDDLACLYAAAGAPCPWPAAGGI